MPAGTTYWLSIIVFVSSKSSQANRPDDATSTSFTLSARLSSLALVSSSGIQSTFPIITLRAETQKTRSILSKVRLIHFYKFTVEISLCKNVTFCVQVMILEDKKNTNISRICPEEHCKDLHVYLAKESGVN